MPLQYKLFCSLVLEKTGRREQIGYLSEINWSSRHFKHSTNWPSTLVTLDLSPKMDANPPGGVLLGIFSGGVPPASPNPDPISDLKIPFPTPVFRPGLKNLYPFSDQNGSKTIPFGATHTYLYTCFWGVTPREGGANSMQPFPQHFAKLPLHFTGIQQGGERQR